MAYLKLKGEKWPEISRLAKTRAPEAIQVLSDIMMDKNEPGSTRINAANAILDRGYGRPKARLDVSGSIDVNASHLHAIKVLAEQVTAESRLLASAPAGASGHDIEVIPVPLVTIDQDPKLEAKAMRKTVARAARFRERDRALPEIFR